MQQANERRTPAEEVHDESVGERHHRLEGHVGRRLGQVVRADRVPEVQVLAHEHRHLARNYKHPTSNSFGGFYIYATYSYSTLSN